MLRRSDLKKKEKENKNMNKYEELYKRGIIDAKEYENIKVIDLDLALETKLEREFNHFKRGLKKLPKNKIINKAYEITAKEEIKDTLINMELHDAEKEMLFMQDDVLNEFYHDWLDSDVPLGDSMQYCIEESIATLTKYMGKKNISKER